MTNRKAVIVNIDDVLLDGYVPTYNATTGEFDAVPATVVTSGGSDTQIQFNDGGTFGGDAGLTYNKTSNLLSLSDAIAIGNNTSTTGPVRIGNNTFISGRNAANSLDGVLIGIDASNNQIVGDSSFGEIRLRTSTGAAISGSYLAIGSNAASAGVIRLANSQSIRARNNANNGDFTIAETSSNDYIYIGTDSTLAANRASRIYIVPSSDTYVGAGGNAVIGFNGTSGATLLNNLPLVAAGSSYISMGASPSTTGSIRLSNNSTIKMRNAANNADVQALYVDTGNLVWIGDAANAAGFVLNVINDGIIRSSAFYVQGSVGSPTRMLLGSTGTDQISLGAIPATAGAIRMSNALGILARNAGNSADITIAATDASDNVNLGSGATSLTAVGKLTIGASGPTITQGSGAPSASEANGSIYLRNDGTPTTGIYTRQGGSWSTAGATAAGSNTQVQFNDGGTAFGGDAGLTYNKTTNILSVSDGVAVGATPATSGGFRLTNSVALTSRNNANTDDLILAVSNTSDQLIVGGGNVTQLGGKAAHLSTIGHYLTDNGTGTILYLEARYSKRIALYNGTFWFEYEADATSTNLSLTGLLTSAGNNFDVYAYWTGSAVALTVIYWGGATRSNPNALITQVNGVWVNSQDNTKRLIGSIRSTGSGTTEDSVTKRFISNYYNRRVKTMRVGETANSWAFAGGVMRPYNNNTANRVEFIICDPLGVEVQATAKGMVRYTASDWGAQVNIGLDSTTTGNAYLKTGDYTIANAYTWPVAEYRDNPGVGYHYLQMLEAAGNTVTYYGDNNDPSYFQTGLVGWFMG